jgi:prepilin-type N-terminal cleavage/methylation domain-containing protein
MKLKKQDNKGFTLIEVLLSITILAILFLPALNSFVTIAKVNSKAEVEQRATTLANNILESLKTMSLEETATQFHGAEQFDVLSSNLNGFTNGYTMKSYAEQGYGEYMLSGYNYIPADMAYLGNTNRKLFYFAMKDVVDHGITFDAFITLNTAVYSDTTKYNDTMNNYIMPRLLEINDNTMAVIDLDNSMDDQAISDFVLIRSTYLTYLANQPIPTVKPGDPTPVPTPAPPTITEAEMKENTKKDITINLSKDAVKNRINVVCQVTYTCNIDLNDDGVVETISPSEVYSGSFPIPTTSAEEGNLYLFYTPSIFTNRDTININNNGSKVNFYIANQTEGTTSTLTVNKNNTNSGSTTVFTNYQSTLINNLIVDKNNLYSKKQMDQRIYNITVSIYPQGTIASMTLANAYVTFTSAKGD